MLEFGIKVLGLQESDVTSTVAFAQHAADDPVEADMVFRSRVLAYAKNTWYAHATAVKRFISFCSQRDVGIFNCTPSLVNVFQLKLAQDRKSFQTVERTLSSLSFVYRFFLMPNFTEDPSVYQVTRFVKKACYRVDRRKDALGSAEIRKMWDNIDLKYGGVEKLSKVELRSFVMTVLQHNTFCRFSDLQQIKLSDVIFNSDYFKFVIRYSKTDQSGQGSCAFMPKNSSGFRDPHMLLCLYLQNMDFPSDPDTYLFPPLT